MTMFYVKCLIIVIIVMVSGCIFKKPTPPPSDDELIKRFKDKREVFDQLIAAIYEDDYFIVSYDPKWSKPEDIPSDKRKQYYNLLKKINADQIIKRGSFVEICVWAVGLGGEGDSKGYTYRPDSYNDVVGSLDNFTSKGREEYLMRDIGEGWYLYYDHFP